MIYMCVRAWEWDSPQAVALLGFNSPTLAHIPSPWLWPHEQLTTSHAKVQICSASAARRWLSELTSHSERKAAQPPLFDS